MVASQQLVERGSATIGDGKRPPMHKLYSHLIPSGPLISSYKVRLLSRFGSIIRRSDASARLPYRAITDWRLLSMTATF